MKKSVVAPLCLLASLSLIASCTKAPAPEAPAPTAPAATETPAPAPLPGASSTEAPATPATPAPTDATVPLPPPAAPATPAPVAPTPAATSASVQDFSKTVKYTVPGSEEETVFALTVTDGVVTALTVTPKATNPVSTDYQTKFAAAVNASVVGKGLKGLKIGIVAGASLTSAAFESYIGSL